MFASLSEAALWRRSSCFLFRVLGGRARDPRARGRVRALRSVFNQSASRTACIFQSLVGIACRSGRGAWDRSTPFSRALAGSWSPRVRFSSAPRRFFWTDRGDFISCFWGDGKCHLRALLSWWESIWRATRGGYSGSRKITSRLAAGARDPQALEIRRQISVGWPGGGASATVSPLFRWSPWRGNSFMEQTVFVPCFCAIDVDLLDYRWCKGTGLYDDAPDWRDARGLSLSWELIITEESNSPHQAMQSNIFTGGESLSSSRSGWYCFAHYGGFAGIPGWPAQRLGAQAGLSMKRRF